MPNVCVVGGCSNKPNKSTELNQAATLFKFPNKATEQRRHEAWVRFVNLTRADFTAATGSSVLCSQHFSPEQFRNLDDYLSAQRAGGMRRVNLALVADAVPHITPSSLTKRKRPSVMADRRRKRLERVIQHNQYAVAKATQGYQASLADSDEEDFSDDESPFEEVEADVINDPEWLPDDGSDVETDAEPEQTLEDLHKVLNMGHPIQETKLIVGSGNLLKQISRCWICGGGQLSAEENTTQVRLSRHGVCATFHMTCTICPRKWSYTTLGSGRRSETRAVNDVILSSILFTGAQPVKIHSYMKSNSIMFPSRRHFFQRQKDLYNRVVLGHWETEKKVNISDSATIGDCCIGGDGRCDSMGFSAQFGSYTVMDLNSHKILDIQPVSKVETKMNSNAMEVEGLKRCLAKLAANNLVPAALVTDRHASITKLMREQYANIEHYFDCWHVMRSIQKTLKAKAKSDREVAEHLTEARIAAIINRLYAMAASTPRGEAFSELMDEKRRGILNHVVGLHVHDDNKLYKKCTHGHTDTERIPSDSAAYEELVRFFNNTRIRKAIRQLSPVGQTSRLELYHSVILSFAPKHISFGFAAMHSRLLLAAIHYNENCNKAIVADDRQPVLEVVYPKFMYGRGKARLTREPSTNDYVNELMQETYSHSLNESYSLLPQVPEPPATMTSTLDTENAEVVKEQFKTRFSM